MAAYHKLLDELTCTTIVTTDLEMPTVRALLETRSDMKVVALPSLDRLLEQQDEGFEDRKEYSATQDDVAFVVHTSGSTSMGNPHPGPFIHHFANECTPYRSSKVDAHHTWLYRESSKQHSPCCPQWLHYGVPINRPQS